MQDVFIAGYSDKLSARPGETVTFSVSSRAREAFRATLHRSDFGRSKSGRAWHYRR